MIENDKKIMRGEFRGDFTRDTFDPMKAFSRVLMQQGRVQIDADWNEQISILLYVLRTMACDIGGPHWGPNKCVGFEIGTIKDKEGKEAEEGEGEEDNDFCIGAGHYYVNGILCELEKEISYKCQPNYPCPSGLSEGKSYLVYLDVWERHISYVEDDDIREVALGGSDTDTASRAKVVCQVKALEIENILTKESCYSDFLDVLKSQNNKCQNSIFPGTGKMQAKIMDKPRDDKKPCLVAPESRYRGMENQLYRVEIHNNNQEGAAATFKWSRENGAVIFPIMEQIPRDDNSLVLALEHLGRDDRFSLKPNNWVEIVDDDYILQNRAENLLQVQSVDHENQQVTLKWLDGKFNSTVDISANKSPYLRRWDQNTGNEEGIVITDGWQPLEDGIEIQFPESNAVYQTGDYWLIPARTATGGIQWPDDTDGPKAMLPHGVIHHYAPLATIVVNACGGVQALTDLRRKLTQIWECAG